jgi:hypothetical protein
MRNRDEDSPRRFASEHAVVLRRSASCSAVTGISPRT